MMNNYTSGYIAFQLDLLSALLIPNVQDRLQYPKIQCFLMTPQKWPVLTLARNKLKPLY